MVLEELMNTQLNEIWQKTLGLLKNELTEIP